MSRAESTIRLYESKSIAENYFKYRPTVPEELLEQTFTFADYHGTGKDLAVDLACGSGQSTFSLCGVFHRVVGVDISEAQIQFALEKAKRFNNLKSKVEFIVCPASNLPFENSSVDLIHCSIAWHFLDPATVHAEVDRVLKTNGILAIYGQGFPRFLHQGCEELFCHLLDHHMVWNETFYGNSRTILKSVYGSVKLPYPLERQYNAEKHLTMSLEDVAGMIRSTDSYDTYCKEHPGTTALESMVTNMKSLLLDEKGVSSTIKDSILLSDVTIEIDIPYTLLLARK